jgi:catechol 2,3-dioxygenase-like lactoylglutathione lyase family enzyme
MRPAVRPAFLDHLTLDVRDLAASRRFYAAALAPWAAREEEVEGSRGTGIAFGPAGAEDFIIQAAGRPTTPLHVAFLAPDRETVDAFHAAALAAGGTDNGAPGPRPQYHAGYYAAFVLDPDGHNVEAVFHGPRD